MVEGAMEIIIATTQVRVPVTIVRPQGKLDSSSAGYFTEVLRNIVEEGARDVLVDFSKVPYMSSVGIRSLTAAYDWLHPVHSVEERKAVGRGINDGTYKAPHLKLANLSPRVLNVLSMVGLDRYLEIFDDEKTALAAF
jgi:hypothetical protein